MSKFVFRLIVTRSSENALYGDIKKTTIIIRNWIDFFFRFLINWNHIIISIRYYLVWFPLNGSREAFLIEFNNMKKLIILSKLALPFIFQPPLELMLFVFFNYLEVDHFVQHNL